MNKLIIYILIGFLTQMIDGSIGMAYGVSCRTFLRTVAKLPSPIASAVIHIAEIPSSLASGISHYKIGNVEKKLLPKLLIPGMIGGVLGAWVLVDLGDRIAAIIDIYLIVMGIIILRKAIHASREGRLSDKLIPPLGFAGGFLDAVGGGGWGPVVTSTMVAAGEDIKKTIGTVNAAEFLVTIAETTTFAVFISDFSNYGFIIMGLIIGGVIAAPIAAKLCSIIPEKVLMGIVGAVIIILNIINLAKDTNMIKLA